MFMKWVSLFLCFFVALNAKAKIPISIETDIYNYAQQVLGEETIESIEHFNHPSCLRDVVEFILVQKAIKLGGVNLEYDFVLGDYDARNIRLIQHGLLLISFDSIWLNEASQYDKDVFISDPVIRNGEFYAGIYVSHNKVSDLKPKLAQSISNLSFVTSEAWHTDVKTLTALKPKNLVIEADWLVMAKMVSNGWVDAMLAPFKPSMPFEYIGKNYNIRAIDGVKVALQDSRHFVVSKKHPLGDKTFIALQKGLKQLRKSGFIERAYKECGFLNPLVDDWQEIKAKMQ
ncbi:hypothetical protein CWC21_16065 [Pseudoalteromonas phenolica]|nr:hypothetical protein CWC21_16065 [Pseudoalteromonas phenolica]